MTLTEILLSLPRLRRELQSLQKSPIENIEAVPTENDIKVWHFVIKGSVQCQTPFSPTLAPKVEDSSFACALLSLALWPPSYARQPKFVVPFLCTGATGSAYEGGLYHGKVEFTKDYPLKPPAIRLLTPSGRFKEGSKLCFSFSDFHPESWNPMW